MKRSSAVLCAVLLITVGGCASHSRDTGLAHVHAMLADRGAGNYRVQWNTNSQDDASAAAAVHELLSRELSVDDAVQVALLNNRRLQATFEDIGVAQADLVQAGLLRNPVFSADFKFSTSGGGTNVELAAAQEFLDVLFVPMRQRIARNELELAKVHVSAAVMDLAGDVRRAFYSHQAAIQTLEMRRTIADATGTSADFAKRLRDAGNITELRLARERAMHEQSKLDLATAEADVHATRERLNALMGLWGEDTARWTLAPHLPDVPKKEQELADVESRAVERNLELAAAKAELNAKGTSLGMQKSVAPFGGGDVELGAAAERDTDGGWGVGPAVSVPVPLFDTGSARVSRAQAELRRARQNYAATAVEVRSAARAARDALFAARQRAENLRDVVLPLRHTIVEQTQAQYNAMLIGTFDVLAAKQDEIEAGASYVTALRDYWLARAQLDQVINGRARPRE